MRLPDKVIDRLFERLGATYGNQWMSLWRGIPIEDIKATWAHELGGFSGRLEALVHALDHLPERAPNAIEFRNLARTAPSPEPPRLPRPEVDPERVAATLAAIRNSLPDFTKEPTTKLAWAHRIIERAQAGEHVHVATLRTAREATQRERSSTS